MNYLLSFIFYVMNFIKATEQIENNFLCQKNDYFDKLKNNFLQCYIDFVQSRIKDLQESIVDVSTDVELITRLKSKNIQTYNDLKKFILDDNEFGYFYKLLYCSIVNEWYNSLSINNVKNSNLQEQENLLQNITLSKFQKILSCFNATFFEILKEKYKKNNENDETSRYWHIYNYYYNTLDKKIQEENTSNENKPVGKIYYDPLDINDKFMINTVIEKSFENAILNEKKNR